MNTYDDEDDEDDTPMSSEERSKLLARLWAAEGRVPPMSVQAVLTSKEQ